MIFQGKRIVSGLIVSGGAMGLLLLAACQSPGVKELKRPMTGSARAAALLRPDRLSGPTRQILAREELLRSYEREPDAVIVEWRRRLDTDSSLERRVALAELCATMATSEAGVAPMRALAYFLACAELAYPVVTGPGEGGGHADLMTLYNYSCSQAAVLLHESGYKWGETIGVKGPGRAYTFRSHTRDYGFIDPASFDGLYPVEFLKVQGIAKRHVQKGFGGALVGYRENTPERMKANPFLSPVGMAVPMTSTIHFSPDGSEVQMAMHDVLVKDDLIVHGRDLVLSADFTISLAVLLEHAPSKPVGFQGFLDPGEYSGSSGLFELEPFRPRQIPVVFVHGLISSPKVWLEALNELRGDPFLREHTQVFVAYYPTGFPIPHNAAQFRARMEQFREYHDPDHRNPMMSRVMMIGHSMGGLLSNLQTRDSGEEMRRLFFEVPLEDTTLDPATTDALRRLFYFEANPDIERVVFMATPHRGSKVADSPIGQLGSLFIKLPLEIFSLQFLKSEGAPPVEGMTPRAHAFLQRPVDSVTGMRQDNPILELLLGLPAGEEVTYHSIIGRMGPGKKNGGSDGIVPYASAHFEGAVSEKIVQANHAKITSKPEAIEEVRRLIYLHLGEEYPPRPRALAEVDEVAAAGRERSGSAPWPHRRAGVRHRRW
jgi:hypothetical protein